MKKFLCFRFRRVRNLASIMLVTLLTGALARGDVVFAWNELLLHLATNSSPPLAPHLEARAFAMAHLAIDEAVSAAARIASDDQGRISAQRSAAVAAAHAVLAHVLPGGRPSFTALAERHLTAIPAGTEKTRGLEAGRAAAERILAVRQHDRWVEITLFNPPFGPLPDSSETVASELAQGGQLPPSPWLKVIPFALKTARQFPVREVRTINHGGAVIIDYALQSSRLFNAVQIPSDSDSSMHFWSQRPVVVWNRIARQLAATQYIDLPQQAKLLAVLNAALADATLSTLHWRHAVGSWRCVFSDVLEPVDESSARSTDVFVRVAKGHDTELMRVEAQRILIPPTPNYPSVAATSAGAAQAVLESFFKTDRVEFTLPDVNPHAANSRAPVRTFSSISAAARENAFVASLDGRHSREACIAGFWLGASIGGFVKNRPLGRRP